jgi:hypothetical protein
VSWAADAIFGAVAPVRWPADAPLRLHLVVDTEESFDWSGPFRREGHDLRALRALPLLIRRLERSRVVPTCVVTWPVVASADGRAILGELLASRTIAVGAHLHPWVTPPFEEPLGSATSYAGNLAPGLEAAKLAALGERIGEALGRRPRVYKAGRYGLGPATAGTLDRLGYRIDLSGYPRRDLRGDGGPDYRTMPDRPFLFGPGLRLLELPMSCGHVGRLAGLPGAARLLDRPRLARLRVGGALARTGLLERVTLTPEGFTLAEQARLARALLARGHRLLCLSLHSPSLAPGNTPYAPDAAACSALLDRLEGVLDLVLGELGGVPTTAEAVLDGLEAQPASRADDAAARDRTGSAG